MRGTGGVRREKKRVRSCAWWAASMCLVAATSAAHAQSKPKRQPKPAAAAPPAISMEAAVRRAVAWHPSVNEAVALVSEHAEQINVARSGYYPQVQGGFSTTYDRYDRDIRYPKFNVSASQMLYDFGKTSTSVEAAEAGTRATQADLLLSVDLLVRDTAYAVIEVQRNSALREVARRQVGRIGDIARLVRARVADGASTRSDEVQAQARVQAARSTLLQIEAELNRWQSNVSQLVGSYEPLSVEPKVPAWLPKACEADEVDWDNVPTIMIAEAQRKYAMAQLEQSRAQSMPTISVQAGTGAYVARAPAHRTDFSVGLMLSAPLYQGGANRARQSSAGHALRAANASLENARFEVRRSLLEARQQTGNLAQLVASLKSRQSMMNETRNLYRQQYLELGTRTLLDLLNAEQELHAAQFDQVMTEHNLRRLWMDCTFNAGRTRQAFALDDMMVRGVALQR